MCPQCGLWSVSQPVCQTRWRPAKHIGKTTVTRTCPPFTSPAVLYRSCSPVYLPIRDIPFHLTLHVMHVATNRTATTSVSIQPVQRKHTHRCVLDKYQCRVQVSPMSEIMKYYNGPVLTSMSHLLSHRRVLVFGHMARLDDDTPANMALQLHINVSLNRPPDCKWLDQLRNDSTCPTGELWRRAVDRGHWCNDATALAGYVTTTVMMMISNQFVVFKLSCCLVF